MIMPGSSPRLVSVGSCLMGAIRILIVDDMAQVRTDLRTILPLAGEMSALTIEIAGEAADGYDAIRLAGELRPDVVLMDLSMPRLDGYRATQEIKALYPDMKVLVLTVHGAQDARQKARRAGADGFIEKGAPVAEIIHQIHHHCDYGIRCERRSLAMRNDQ